MTTAGMQAVESTRLQGPGLGSGTRPLPPFWWSEDEGEGFQTPGLTLSPCTALRLHLPGGLAAATTTQPTGATSSAKSKGPTLLVPRAAAHARVVPTKREELLGSQQQALAWSVFSLVPRVRLLLPLGPPSPTGAPSVKPQGREMPAGSPFALPQPPREARPAEITDAQRGTGFSPGTQL